MTPNINKKNQTSISTQHLTIFSPLILYSIILFLLSTGDAIMSYVSPIFIENRVNSTLVMGIILSASSLIGLICDLLFSFLFRKKKYTFFLIAAIVCALAFPITFILFPPWISILLFSMLIWGIYYEFLVFSDFHFVNRFVQPKEHASAWGVLETFRSASYLIGPILASFLLTLSNEASLYVTICFVLASLFCFITFLKVHPKTYKEENYEVKKNPIQELKLWSILMKKIWPLYLFTLTLGIIDSTFWSVGTLLSEEFKTQSPYGGFLIAAYMLPSLLLGFITGIAAKPFGKKKAAFICGILGGILLMALYISNSIPLFILIVLASSFFLAIASVEMAATFEDYVGRVGIYGNDVIGLQSSSASVAYIVGPIISGYIASVLGYRATFMCIGGVFTIVSLIALVVVPRKIKMPTGDLKNLEK